MKIKDLVKDDIIQILSVRYPFCYQDIRNLFDNMRYIDTVIDIIEIALKHKLTLNEAAVMFCNCQ